MATAAATPEVFVRKSSGLVRVMSPSSAFIYNVLTMGLIFPWTYLWAPGALPGGQLVWGILLAMVLEIPIALSYVWLSTAFPRTGGDYVFQSRVFGGGIAFTLVFSGFVIWILQWVALSGWLLSTLGFAPLFLGLAAVDRQRQPGGHLDLVHDRPGDPHHEHRERGRGAVDPRFWLPQLRTAPAGHVGRDPRRVRDDALRPRHDSSQRRPGQARRLLGGDRRLCDVHRRRYRRGAGGRGRSQPGVQPAGDAARSRRSPGRRSSGRPTAASRTARSRAPARSATRRSSSSARWS